MARVPVNTIVYVPLYLYRVGKSSLRYKVTAVHAQTHHMSLLGPQIKEAQRINRILLHVLGLPSQSLSGLVGQCPGHLKHPLGSHWPAKTTWYTQPTQRLLPHTAFSFSFFIFFQDSERAILCNSYKQTVSSKMKI